MRQDRGAREQASVVIVGGGPSGLSLALGLARHGIHSILFEKNERTSQQSKAAGIHVRTREALHQWGVDERILEAGELVRTVRLHAAETGRVMVSYDLTELDGEADRAGLVMLEQGETERILLEAVAETGLCDLRFGAEVVRLDRREDGATVWVREEGEERPLDARYLVGCDGASSFVRGALGLPFEGITYSVQATLADVRVIDARDTLPWPRVFNGRGGLTTAIRIRPGLWRLIRLEPGVADPGREVTEEDLRPRVGEVLGAGAVEVVWASRFRIHRRASPRFRVGSVLLAGDAAHIHSPIGGQGMNAGIQDAHNLAWKLAYALRGGDRERLLDSYDVERRAIVVGSVSRTTDALTRIFLQTPAFVRRGAFFLARLVMQLPGLRRRILRRMTMIDLDAPPSPLLDARARAAGVRLPNLLLSSPYGTWVRLHDLLPSAPVLLEVSSRKVGGELPVDHVIRFGPEGYTDPSGTLRRLLGRREGWILVRPDGHIAWARHRREGLEAAVDHALGSGVVPARAEARREPHVRPVGPLRPAGA